MSQRECVKAGAIRRKFEENRSDPRYCRCGTKLRTGNRTAGICDRCQNKLEQGKHLNPRSGYEFLHGLEKIKEDRGLSWAEIARQADLKPNAIRSIGGGSRMLRASADVQLRLARILGVSLETLRNPPPEDTRR